MVAAFPEGCGWVAARGSRVEMGLLVLLKSSLGNGCLSWGFTAAAVCPRSDPSTSLTGSTGSVAVALAATSVWLGMKSAVISFVGSAAGV